MSGADSVMLRFFLLAKICRNVMARTTISPTHAMSLLRTLKMQTDDMQKNSQKFCEHRHGMTIAMKNSRQRRTSDENDTSHHGPRIDQHMSPMGFEPMTLGS